MQSPSANLGVHEVTFEVGKSGNSRIFGHTHHGVHSSHTKIHARGLHFRPFFRGRDNFGRRVDHFRHFGRQNVVEENEILFYPPKIRVPSVNLSYFPRFSRCRDICIFHSQHTRKPEGNTILGGFVESLSHFGRRVDHFFVVVTILVDVSPTFHILVDQNVVEENEILFYPPKMRVPSGNLSYFPRFSRPRDILILHHKHTRKPEGNTSFAHFLQGRENWGHQVCRGKPGPNFAPQK